MRKPVLPDRPPIRIQRLRTPGWRMPETAIYVGRPTRVGNPYKPVSLGGGVYGISRQPWWRGTYAEALNLSVHNYRMWLDSLSPWQQATLLAQLRGFDLCCWCPLVDAHGAPHPCHADVLMELANREAADA